MNVYALEGMIAEASVGARVIAVVRDQRSAHETLNAAGVIAGDRAVKICRAAGRERLDVGTGSVSFVSCTVPMNGRSADSVFIDVGCNLPDVVADAYPIVAASGGKLVFA